MKIFTKKTKSNSAYPGIRQLKARRRLNCQNYFHEEKEPKQSNSFKQETKFPVWFSEQLNKLFVSMEQLFSAEETSANPQQQIPRQSNHKDLFISNRVVEWQVATTHGTQTLRENLTSSVSLVDKINIHIDKLVRKIKMGLWLDYFLNVENLEKFQVSGNSSQDEDENPHCIMAASGNNLVHKAVGLFGCNSLREVIKTSNKRATDFKFYIPKKMSIVKELLKDFSPIRQKVVNKNRLSREQLE